MTADTSPFDRPAVGLGYPLTRAELRQLQSEVVVHWDGGCSLKRGVAAGAAVVYSPAGEVLAERAKFMVRQDGLKLTTPMAEYTALTVGLHAAFELGATSVVAWGDAELVVRQVDGRYRCKDDRLLPMLGLVHVLMGRFQHVEVREFPKGGPRHKRRWLNVAADALASECIAAGADIMR